MRSLALLLACLAAPAAAQDWQPVQEVAADLDGDGAPETYRLEPGGDGFVDLAVEAAGWTRRVEDAAWTGGPGQQPELSVNDAGSVVLTSMNEAVGRNRWRMDVTIAHRQGDWRVAGFTYGWHDTLDLSAWGQCDINLLSGRGVLETESSRREIEAPLAAPPLWDWAEAETALLEACGL